MNDFVIRGFSLWQPWASLIALGHKKIETRPKPMRYRGWLAIHSTLRYPPEARAFAEEERAAGRLPAKIPIGAIVAIAKVIDCRPTEEMVSKVSDLERRMGNYGAGRSTIILDQIHAVPDPVFCIGAQGLWKLGPAPWDKLMSQFEHLIKQ